MIKTNDDELTRDEGDLDHSEFLKFTFFVEIALGYACTARLF